MMLRIVILSYGQLRGEYNITETARFAISLYLPRRIFFIFGKYLSFSKYVTHYDTFTY